MKINPNALIIAGAALSLSGCMSVPGVNEPSAPLKVGDDTYMMKVEAIASSAPNRRAQLNQYATAHCEKMGRKMERIASNQNRGGSMMDYTLDIEYKCVAK